MSETLTHASTDAATPLGLALNGLEGLAVKVSPEMTRDEVAEVLVALDGAAARIKQIRDAFDANMLEYVKANGPQMIGTVKYFVDQRKTTKCRDKGKAVDAVLTAVGGDFAKLVELMPSEPLKYGACKAVLGDAWGEHFEVSTKDKLGQEKPKELQSMDTRWLK